MKKLLLAVCAIALLASCGGREIVLDAKHDGEYYTFSYPSGWKVTSREAETIAESSSCAIAFRYAGLEGAKENDAGSIEELVQNYIKSVEKNGSIGKSETVDIGGKKAVWIESSSASIYSVNIFIPMAGGVYIGETQNIAESDMLEAARKAFASFRIVKTPEAKNPENQIEYITHNGVIYTISFPKHWTIYGDNPMTIRGDGKSIEIAVTPDAKVKAGELASMGKPGLAETIIGNAKALEQVAGDRSWFTHEIPLAKKVMTIKTTGHGDKIDPVLDFCLKSFKYFPEKDVVAAKPSDSESGNTASGQNIKPADRINIPTPDNTNIPTGETHETKYYSVILPKSWIAESQTEMIESIYPPDRDSRSYIDISVQAYMNMSAMEIAKIQIDVIEGTKPEIKTVDVAGTKAAQFTYDAGSGTTVNTIVTKGEYQYTITYYQGKRDYRNEYAAILKTFGPK